MFADRIRFERAIKENKLRVKEASENFVYSFSPFFFILFFFLVTASRLSECNPAHWTDCV